MAASIQVSFASPAFLIQEAFAEFAYPSWTRDLVTGSAPIRNGHIGLPERPGLGVELDVSVALAHPLKGDRVIDLLAKGWEGRSDVANE